MRTAVACTASGGTPRGYPSTCTPNSCPLPLCPGDTNCNGEVTFADIDRFIEALDGESAWAHWPCPWLSADCNGDDDVTYADIDAFVTLMGATCRRASDAHP